MDKIDYLDKNILVCGLGKTGFSVIDLLYKLNASKVTLYANNIDNNAYEKLKKYKGLKVIQNNPTEMIDNYDIIIPSPGIPIDIDYLKKAFELNVSVISEIELANRFYKGTTVAITGTNGKTTTTMLVNEMLKEYYKKSYALGNIGIPFSEKVLECDENTYIALELSSYQLETTYNIKPKVSAVLNISNDHLDRHKTLANYINAKERIFINQDKNDFCILNYDNVHTSCMSNKTSANVIYFSRKFEIEHMNAVYVKNNEIVTNITGELITIIKLDEILIKGNHNIENVLSSIAMALAVNIPIDSIVDVVKKFGGVEHRQEYVDTINGIEFWNDSKATNVDSAINAINALDKNIILIVGGDDKNQALFELVKEIYKNVRYLAIIGSSKDRFVKNCNKIGYKNYSVYNTLEDAVKGCYDNAKVGDCVLLAPGCASFDMFDNFEHRGNVFKEAVKNLRG